MTDGNDTERLSAFDSPSADELLRRYKFDSDMKRLHAAAPDLLAACEEMHRTLTSPSREMLDSTREEMGPWLPMLEAAIEKATKP